MKKNERRVKLEGTKYGNWDIVEYVGTTKHRSPQYRCICDCGKEKVIRSCGVKLASFSCGCQNPGRWKKGTFAPADQIDKFATLRSRYKRDAKDRGFSFDLTVEQFNELIVGKCYYCDRKEESGQMYNFREYITYTGIDRVNNEKGYTIENCVSCCKDCNILKKAVTPNIIKKAYRFLFGDEDV